ncbi:hypothetical protein [Sphingomonas immobilis]|uniref:DUF2029 domain-containing protein n=1 Tax=Sphingomonas immobilis TaxID=3063997 RepID=A0ABT9A446_9SPHN|nr:hypothetical protein [Sphingomonas sp. CA1-15]MDO7844616.1 hypothetical protein [Sphingomonas sp. CA1-15]
MTGSRAALHLRRLLPIVTFAFLSLAICAASFNGFFDKWGFRDESPDFSLKANLDGTAQRPFAYRRLMVDTVQAVAGALPGSAERMAEKIVRTDKGEMRVKLDPAIVAVPAYTLRYLLMYALTLATVVVLLAAAYRLGRDSGAGPPAAYAGAAAFVLVFPMLQSVGGYFYDFLETALFCLFLIAAQRRSWWAMLALAALGSWNKESYLFFILTALPLVVVPVLHNRAAAIRAAIPVGASVIVAGLVYLFQKHRFGANPGVNTESHIPLQIRFFTSPANFFKAEITYGVPLPHPMSLIALAAIGGAAVLAWPRLSRARRWHIALAALVNIPLFVLFCGPGEVRNLSMLFPALVMLFALAIESATTKPTAPVAAGVPQ